MARRVASRRVASPWLLCLLLPRLVSSRLVSSRLVSSRLGSARLGSPRLASFLRLVEKSSVVNGNSGFIVPLQTMPGNIIKTFRRNILMLTHRFTVRQTFRSSKLLRLCVSVSVPRLPSSFFLSLSLLSRFLVDPPPPPSLPSAPRLVPFRDFKSSRCRLSPLQHPCRSRDIIHPGRRTEFRDQKFPPRWRNQRLFLLFLFFFFFSSSSLFEFPPSTTEPPPNWFRG